MVCVSTSPTSINLYDTTSQWYVSGEPNLSKIPPSHLPGSLGFLDHLFSLASCKVQGSYRIGTSLVECSIDLSDYLQFPLPFFQESFQKLQHELVSFVGDYFRGFCVECIFHVVDCSE